MSPFRTNHFDICIICRVVRDVARAICPIDKTHNSCLQMSNANFKIIKMSTMLVDLYPMSPATATAANNLVRCLMGAAGTAVIIQMIDGMGRGWCFTFIAAVIFFTSPLLWVELKWGPKWREARREKVERQEGEQKLQERQVRETEKD